MDLNFHQTFKPEKNYISELLLAASSKNRIDLNDLSKLTGIPQGKSSGKLVPHIKYAKYMGLIDYSISNGVCDLCVTDLGRIVLEQDVSISERVTLLTLHSNIVNYATGADLWSFAFHIYFEKYGASSKYDFFTKEVEHEFGKTKLGPLVKSYEEFFSPLKLLIINTKNHSEDGSIQFFPLKCDQELIPAIGYVLYDYWDKKFAGETEITSNQLEDLGFRNVFGWTRFEEMEALDRLSDYGIIRLNKQLMPFTILRLVNKEHLLSRLYSELY